MRKYVRADAIEQEVLEAVSGLMDDKEYVLRKMEEHFAQKRRELSRAGTDGARLARKVAGLNRRRDGYWELAADGDMPRELMRKKVAELEEEREAAARELERIKNRDAELQSLDKTEREMREGIEATENNLEGMTPKERRELYRDLRLRVEVGEDKHARISGLFPIRVGGVTGTLWQTPEQRRYLITGEPIRGLDTPSARTSRIISGWLRTTKTSNTAPTGRASCAVGPSDGTASPGTTSSRAPRPGG